MQSEKDRIVEEAIKAVAVHRIQDMVPELEEGVGKSYSFARILGQITAQALRQDPVNFEKQLQRVSGDFLAGKSEEYQPLNDRILCILVIQKSKSLRKGEETSFAVPDTNLTAYHKLLLEYSAMPQADAVASITQRLMSADIAGDEEYNLVRALDTYGRQSVGEVVQLFSDVDIVQSMTSYGRLLLLRALSQSSHAFYGNEVTDLRK